MNSNLFDFKKIPLKLTHIEENVHICYRSYIFHFEFDNTLDLNDRTKNDLLYKFILLSDEQVFLKYGMSFIDIEAFQDTYLYPNIRFYHNKEISNVVIQIH